MLKNYFVIAWRSLVRNGTFYFINIFSLSIGLACCLLISAYLYTELTYDTYPEHAKDIYRVELQVTGNGSVVEYPHTDWGEGPGMKNTYGEIASYTRLIRGQQFYMHYKENTFKEEHIALADSNFLEFFSIPALEGDIRTALMEPNTMVVDRAFARKYFGAESPVGKVLEFAGGQLKVTALIDKVPDKSHFQFDAFISLSTFKPRWVARDTWSNIGVFTYLQLNPGVDVKALEVKFRDLVKKYIVPEVQHDMGVSLAEAEKSVETFVFSLRPLTQIHLYSHSREELAPNGDIKYVYILSALAAFILLLACVNFINLSTATSSRRAREVGIRKVMGSVKAQLIYQFLSESVLLSAFGMILAYALVVVLLPYFNQLTGKSIALDFFFGPLTLGAALIALLIVGAIAGIYPAFFLSSFKTVTVLKGNTIFSGSRRDGLRSGLVIFQFAVSTALTIATLVVYQQLNFMQNKKLGYDKDQVLVIEDSYVLRDNEKVFKEQLQKDSRVSAVSIARQVPGQFDINGTQAYPKDKLDAENNSEIHINIYHVDYDFLSTLGIGLRVGRNLSPDFPSDSSGIVINEAAAREFGWGPDNALNKSIVVSGQTEYHVVGVVNDFNYASVRQKIAPLVMMLSRNRGLTIVKINTNDIKGFLADIKKRWESFGPEAPFTYTFLDERFGALYASEERTGRLFTTFAVIALMIAGLGLFGLSAFTAEQRTKEIGIRKVLGASASQVLLMLSRQFLILVLIAFAIAVPFVAWAMNQWLSEFAYRISLQWWVFLAAGALSVIIAFASMSFQAIRAAVADPVESLKME